MSMVTNEEIVAEFENLFKTDEPEEAETPSEPEETPDEAENAEADNAAEESSDQTNETEEDNTEATQNNSEDQESESISSKVAKQNHAFAEQRLQIKKQNDFIKKVGQLVGFDDKATPEEILEKVTEAYLNKQSKEQNVPVDLLKRLERAEDLIQENDRIKLEKKVTEDLTGLIEKYKLNEEDVNAFTKHLIDSGKNPMAGDIVDLDAEYLKLHYEELVQKAVDDALAKERARKDKVDASAPTPTPKSIADKGDAKVTTVSDLDKLFDNLDL